MNTNHTTLPFPGPPAAAGPLETALVRTGYTLGVPPRVSAETVALDARIVQHNLRCPACRRRTMRLKSYRRGERWRGLAVCGAPGCHGEAEI